MRVAVALAVMALAPVLANAQAPATGSQVSRPATDGCRVDARQPRVRLTGTVTDSTGASLASATVTLRCGTFRQDIHTGADGTYRFTAPAGPYQIDVDAPGFIPTAETIELTTAGTNKRDFTLEIGGFESVVTVTAQGGFVAATSTTATKTGAPLIEIPQSVSVVTADQMKARNVQTVNQAIQYSGSVNTDAYGADPRYDWLMIRGFDQTSYGLFRDNSRWQAGSLTGQVDPYLLQEVDVVKGPSSVLFGQNTPGGLVNLVTKRPPKEALNEVILNYGSHDRMQFQGDFGGPIDKAGHVRYRLTGLVRKSDTQVDHSPDNRYMIAPAFTWSPSSRTTLTVLTDFQRDDSGWGRFLPASGTLWDNPNGKIDVHVFTGEPGYEYYHRDQWSAGTLFEHQISQAWTFRNTFRYSGVSVDGKSIYGAGLQDDLRTLTRYGFGSTSDSHLYTTDTHFSVRKKTGTVEHAVLFGVDYSNSETTTVSAFGLASSIDIFAPVYGAAPAPTLYKYYDVRTPLSLVGVYVQDHMKISRRVVATLSLRNDWTKLVTDDRFAGKENTQEPRKLSGRAGLTYLTDFGVAPYFSYSTSFMPVGGATFDGTPYQPTEGEQFEGGVKYQPKHSNSFITASAYQITQTNVTVPDPDHALNFIQEGEIRSRGIELEGVGNAAQGLNFHLSYSYLAQEVTKTTDAAILGKRPPRSPKHLVGAMAEYTFTSGPLVGLGFSGGVHFTGASAGDEQNTIEVPGYTLVDASVRYLWRDVEFLLSGTNIANNLYVATCSAAAYCNYGAGRSLIGTLRYRWQHWGGAKTKQ